ncbi:MAG: enoyl-ACP reductase [Nitrospirota bacterium]
MDNQLENKWALILGSSSGFGEACAIELAKRGMNIFGVHLDRRSTLPNVERIIKEIKSSGKEAIFFNINASDPEKREAVLEQIHTHLSNDRREDSNFIKVFIHSLAFGTLRPYISSTSKETISKSQIDMTLDVMANSLVYWVQDMIKRCFLKKGSRIFAMTSAGGQRVWKSYGAVSSAKAALESHIRQLALELSPLGITANAIRAGVTDTPALRKIPGWEDMIKLASSKNPGGRITTPKDIALAVAVLSHPDIYWMTGNVIGIDGGEFIVD